MLVLVVFKDCLCSPLVPSTLNDVCQPSSASLPSPQPAVHLQPRSCVLRVTATHSQIWVLTKKMMSEPTPQLLAFTLPIHEPLSSQYYIRALPENWFGGDALHTVSFSGLVLPERAPPHTELLDLDPLPASALGNPLYEQLYDGR